MTKIQELLDNLLHKKLGRDVRQSIHDSIEQCYKDATGHPESVAGVIEENKNMQKQLDSNINTINGRIDTILTGTVNTTKLVTVHSATIRNNSASDLTFKISSKDNETLKSIKDKSPTVINANVIAKALDGVAINGKGIPSSYNVESTNDEYVITVYSGSSSVVGQYVFMAVVTIAYKDTATDISSAELKDVRAGADGTVYKSAGEAVRQQIGSLKESLGNVNEDLDNVQDIIGSLGSGGGLSSTFISALQTILTHAVFESNQSQNIQALTKYSQETLAKVTSISALYNGGPVMSGTNILSLKDNIVVTAVYDDGTQETITDYTIIGNINVGSNTLTIKYRRKTTTITVIGTDATHVYSLSNQKFEENTTIDTGIAINDQDRDFTITIDITLLSAATTYGKARMIWKNESNKSIITAMIDHGMIKFAYMDTAETEVYLGSVDSGVSGNDLFDHVYIVLRHKLGEKTLYMKFKGVNTSKKSYTNEKTITANNMKFDDAHLMIGSYNNQLQFLLNATINSLDIYYKAFSDEEVTEFIDQN